MSLSDSYDLLPIDQPQDEGSAPEHIPLEHAIMLASPAAVTPAATVGMSPEPIELPPAMVDPYDHLASRGHNLNTQYLHPAFADRLSRALMDAEAATGQRAVLRDLYRPPERQAQYYANYTQRPITFGGRTYTPNEQGGLAAPPGQSRHGSGQAADIEHGPVLEYLHGNARKYGLEFLSGHAYQQDPGHLQLAGGSPGTQQGGFADAGSGGGPSSDTNEPLGPEPTQPDEQDLASELAAIGNLNEPSKRSSIEVPPVETAPPQPVLSQTPLTVTGADGGLQTIDPQLAQIDPMIGMTQGIMLSPQVQQQLASGELPTYSEADQAQQARDAAAARITPLSPDRQNNRLVDLLSGKYALDLTPVHLPGTEPSGYLRELAQNPDILAANVEQASNFNFGGITHRGPGGRFARAPSPAATPPTTPPPAAGHNMPPGPTPPVTPNAASPITPSTARFTLMDYIRTGDDQNAGLIRYARKTGISPQAVNDLRDTFRVTTGATSQTLADSAAVLGRAEAPNFRFNVRTPLPEIATYARDNQGFNDYLNMYDTLDEIRIRHNQNMNLPQPVPGPTVVRGFTEPDALAYIANAEGANPTFIPARGRYRENVMEARRFAADGEYATMTQAQMAELNRSNPNEVPWSRRNTNVAPTNPLGEPIVRPDPAELAGVYVSSQVRGRMNNEAVGTYVDLVRRSPNGQGIFRRTSANSIRTNPELRSRVVTFERRGVTEHYIAESSTVADLLKMDPYYFSSGMATQALNGLRSTFQANTTGMLAPHFAVTDALRNFVIAKATTPHGFSSPGLAFGRNMVPLGPGSIPYAITSQLIPKLAMRASNVLDSTSGNWLRRVIGPQAVNNISTVLSNAYLRSTFGQVEAMGTHSGSFFGRNADRVQANHRVTQTLRTLASTPGLRDAAQLIHGYRNLLNAVHNSTQFAFVQGNTNRIGRTIQGPALGNLRGTSSRVTLSSLAAQSRELTGNPQTAGRYYTPGGKPIRFDTRNSGFGERVGAKLAQGLLATNEMGRIGIPWYNMTQQGIKRFGTAALNDPLGFSTKAFLYYILPSALGYYLAVHAGNDPNGVSYVDHMMNRRDEYRKSMNFYIPIPGRPAEDGIEFPSFQEAVLAKRMTEDALNHLYGNNTHTYAEDFGAALRSFLDIAILPPMNPAISIAFEMTGNAAPQNFGALLPGTGLGQFSGIGGEVYQRRSDPFDVNKAMSPVLESTLRAIAPTIADLFGAGFAAASHTPDGAIAATRNALKQAGKVVVQRTPLLRDIADLHTPISGNSRFTSEMFAREKAIEQLDSFVKTYGMTGDTMIGRAKPLSRSGAQIAAAATGEALPPNIPGLAQPEPTNPLYKMFAQELYNATKHDSVNTGGRGFRSIWDQYRDASKAIRTMRNIDYGNMVTWQSQMEARPDVVQMLQSKGIDYKNPYAVRNFYERRRQDVTRVINHEMDKIEQQFSQRLGRPIKFTDLDPYKAPNLTQTMVPGAAETPPWNPE